MRQDAYGLPVSTESPLALESYDRAVDGLLLWDNQALDFFRTATTHDPGLALGHADPLLSGQLVHARAARLRARGGRTLRRGDPHGTSGAPQESAGRLGDPRLRPRSLRDGGVRHGDHAAAAGHPSVQAPRLVQEPSPVASDAHALRGR